MLVCHFLFFHFYTHVSQSVHSRSAQAQCPFGARARLSLSLSLSRFFLSLYVRVVRTHTFARTIRRKEEKERGIMGWGEDDRTATDTNNPWHSSHGMTQSKADVAESWVKKNDDSNATSTTTTTTTTKPLQLSKEVEEALSFAKRTKERRNNRDIKITTTITARPVKVVITRRINRRIFRLHLSNKNNTRKVVFAPAPSRPVWTAAPPVAATTTSLDAKAQHFQASPKVMIIIIMTTACNGRKLRKIMAENTMGKTIYQK